MSSQILVHGYVEMPEGSAEENASVLAGIADAAASERDALVHAFGPIRPSWRAVMCSFAASYKATGADDARRFEGDLERILKQLKFVSAHLSIEDPEGGGDRFATYAYGPARFDGPDVLTRVHHDRTSGEPEEVNS